MSLGTAILQVAKYSALITRLTDEITPLENKLMEAVAEKNDKDYAEVNLQLTKLKTLLGLAKDFLEFWKDMIKSLLGILKMFNDLAKGAQ